LSHERHHSERPDEPRPPSLALDAYLDDQLSPDQRLAVEASLQSRPDLHARVELQRGINESLRRQFAAGPLVIRASNAAASTPLRRRWLWMAAGIVLLAVGSAYFVAFRERLFAPTPPPIAKGPPILEAVYQRIVKAGFVPDEVCTDDAAFAKWMGDRYQAPMVIDPKPAGLTLVGWSYPSSMPGYVGALLATQSGQPTVVFVEPLFDYSTPHALPLDQALEQHTRDIGSLRLYQVSPKGAPNLLPGFTRQ
jgi:hypothetical protein